jgi:hypothetical protein
MFILNLMLKFWLPLNVIVYSNYESYSESNLHLF